LEWLSLGGFDRCCLLKAEACCSWYKSWYKHFKFELVQCLCPNRAFSSEVETGSRQENASNQEARAPFRFYRNGKGSRAAASTKIDGGRATSRIFDLTSEPTQLSGMRRKFKLVWAAPESVLIERFRKSGAPSG
jgi:hypothetical protein